MCDALQSMARSYVMVKGVEKDSSVGSGVLVHNTHNASYVLTCAHLLEGDGDYKLVRRVGARFAHDLAYTHELDLPHDLALLVGPHLDGARALCLAEDEPELYTHGYTFGSHAALFGMAADAVITGSHGSHGEKGEDHLVVFTGVAHQGMSGGMLCNLDGELVGLLDKVLTEDERVTHTIGYAVNLPTIRNFLKRSLPQRGKL
jgi:hypothetical protein